MPFVQAKCESCGGILKVDPDLNSANCPFCGSVFLVEKAINNFHTTNNLSANVINVYGESVKDFQIRGGVLEKYNGESTQIVIPDNVTIIGDNAFTDCIGITDVTIPDSVIEIGNSAFMNCSRISSITIPGSVEKIGSSSFKDCKNLHSVIIGEGVQAIGALAFENCTKLEKITFSNTVHIIGSGAFLNCRELVSVSLPENIRNLDKTFYGCSNLSELFVPDSLELVTRGTFTGCLKLKQLNGSENWKTHHRVVLVSFALDNARFAEGMKQFADSITESINNHSKTIEVLITHLTPHDFNCYSLDKHDALVWNPVIGQFNYNPKKLDNIKSEITVFLRKIGVSQDPFVIEDVGLFDYENGQVKKVWTQKGLVVSFMFDEERLKYEAEQAELARKQAELEQQRIEAARQQAQKKAELKQKRAQEKAELAQQRAQRKAEFARQRALNKSKNPRSGNALSVLRIIFGWFLSIAVLLFFLFLFIMYVGTPVSSSILAMTIATQIFLFLQFWVLNPLTSKLIPSIPFFSWIKRHPFIVAIILLFNWLMVLILIAILVPS